MAADLETPGITAKDWKIPIIKACLSDISSISVMVGFLFFKKSFSITIRTIPPIIKLKIAIIKLPIRNIFIDLYKIKPIIAVGRNAIRIFFHSIRFLSKSDPKVKITAKIAPSCITISKLFTNSLCAMLNISEVIIKCAVEEIGRNSVTPSTIPNMTASIKDIL